MTNSKPTANTRRTNAKPKRTQASSFASKAAEAQNPERSRKPSKLDVIRSLITRTGGVSLDELVTATGWQPHSVRAGMTSLRKQGLNIVRTKVDATTRFAIEAPPAEAAS